MDRASGSSSSYFKWSFDVFLSFRGEDTRFNFTSHLIMALRQRGLIVFIDNELLRGEEIPESLLKAIEQSKTLIVIISENYASSSWCLNELEKIIMCNKFNGRVVLPIFYKVDPSEVRNLNGKFGEAFAKLQVRFSNNKMQAWGEALATVTNKSAWVLGKNDGDEAILIQNIVYHVWKIILDCRTTLLPIAKYPVGIDRQVVDLLSHVMIDGTRMVGLYGFGGMGKTTLAKALYNRIAHNFEGCCFLANIREASKQFEGLVRLQEKLLQDILMDGFIKVSDLHKGTDILNKRLSSKRILLILDDIDTSEQLQALAGGHDWFAYGSKVIVTTKDKQLLECHGFSILEGVPELVSDEAVELFSWYAFRASFPPTDYHDLSVQAAVNYCKCHPLALEVLGSSIFYPTDIVMFERTLDGFVNSTLDKNIQDILQVSYDGLEAEEQEMFLLISCFFVREDITMVKTMLEECGILCWERGIKKLMNLNLLTINIRNEIEMHDLIQRMGHALPKTYKSRRLKKLLVEDEAMYVLNDKKEAIAVKAIKLAFRKPRNWTFDSRAFEKVNNLVVLEANNNVVTSLESTLDFLPNSLRWMSWDGFPFSSLPSAYSMKNLIQLNLSRSSIKHFGNAIMSCEKLKQLDLNNSHYLEEIRDLSAAINLEKLNLFWCRKLISIHESMGSLDKLVYLNLSSSDDGFKQFPQLLRLKSLKYLSIGLCKIVEGYPKFSEEMKYSLEKLYLYRSIIAELSPTIGFLISLKYLTIDGCIELRTLPNTIYSLSNLTSLIVLRSDLSTFPSLSPPYPSLFPYLTKLHICETKITNLDFLETIAYVAPSLRDLNLSYNNFSRIPSCIVNFKSLRFLGTRGCELLEEIPKVPEGIISMHAEGCTSLAKFPDNLADFITCDSEYVNGQFKQLILMNCDIPKWYSYKSKNNPMVIFVPSNYRSWELKVFAPCVEFQIYHVDGNNDSGIDLECKVFINDIKVWSSEEVPFFEESKRILIKESPCVYMWLLVLYPHIDFQPHWDDIIERSLKIRRQPSFGVNSTFFNNNNVGDDWNYFVESIWRSKFTVSFGVHPKFKDSVSIKRCGVHVIMEENYET